MASRNGQVVEYIAFAEGKRFSSLVSHQPLRGGGVISINNSRKGVPQGKPCGMFISTKEVRKVRGMVFEMRRLAKMF